MATSGRDGQDKRGQNVTGLLDLSNRKRPKGYVALRFMTVMAAIIAIPCTIAAAVCAVWLFPARADQDAYDRAPICAAGVTDTRGCALQTTATVEYVDVTKNTGKNAHGYTTKADLAPAVGRNQTVTLSKSRDLTFEITTGETWPVLVWRDDITRYTFDGKTHNADENPHEILDGFLIATPAFLAAGSLFGRFFIRRVLWKRVATNPARHRIPEWILLPLTAETIVAAALHASYVAAGSALLGVAVLVGSAAVWPFLPWVMQSDPGSVLGRGRTRTRTPTRRPAPRRR